MNIVFFIFLLLFIVCIGFIFSALASRAISMQKEQTQKIKDYLNEIIHQVKVEKYQNIEYWYDQDTDYFLGQGSTFDDIVNVLKIRFPDHLFILEDRGGVAAQTGWKLVEFEQFTKLTSNTLERVI